MTSDSDADEQSETSSASDDTAGDSDEEVLGMYEQSGDSTVVSDVSATTDSSTAAATGPAPTAADGADADATNADASDANASDVDATETDANTTEADAAEVDADATEPEATDGNAEPRFDAPVIDPGGDDPETVTGTFYVKNAEESAVTLHEVDTTQIVTLIENPGFEVHDIVEATVVAQPPMEVSYLVEDLNAQYSIPVETSPEPPTSHVRGLAEELGVGESVAIAREGDGEIHILRIEPDDVDRVAEDLLEDEMPYKNAARYDVDRVEIRTHQDGIVSIRYLP